MQVFLNVLRADDFSSFFYVLADSPAEAEEMQTSISVSYMLFILKQWWNPFVFVSLSLTAHEEDWSLKRPSAALLPTIPHLCGWHDILTWSDQDKQRYWPLAGMDFLLLLFTWLQHWFTDVPLGPILFFVIQKYLKQIKYLTLMLPSKLFQEINTVTMFTFLSCTPY